MCCCEDPDIDGTPAGRGVEPARWPRPKRDDARDVIVDNGYLLYRRRTWIYVLQAVSASLATASIVWAASIALDRFLVYTLLDAKQRRSNVLLAKVAFIGSQSCAWIVHFFGSVAERDELWAVHRRIFFLVGCWIVDVVRAVGSLVEWTIDRVNQARQRQNRPDQLQHDQEEKKPDLIGGVSISATDDPSDLGAHTIELRDDETNNSKAI